jgi:hypothetical protein
LLLINGRLITWCLTELKRTAAEAEAQMMRGKIPPRGARLKAGLEKTQPSGFFLGFLGFFGFFWVFKIYLPRRESF